MNYADKQEVDKLKEQMIEVNLELAVVKTDVKTLKGELKIILENTDWLRRAFTKGAISFVVTAGSALAIFLLTN